MYDISYGRHTGVYDFLTCFRRIRYYNPSDPTDAEELLNLLEELDSSDEVYNQINEFAAMNLVLFPPQDGRESDIDDAPSDDEDIIYSIRDIGKSVLKQPMEIMTTNEKGENLSYIQKRKLIIIALFQKTIVIVTRKIT